MGAPADMDDGQVPRFISAIAALAGFMVAILAGLSADNSAEAILVRAIVALAICAVAGYAIGAVAAHVVRVEMRKIDAATEAALAAEMESSAANSSASLESTRVGSDGGESVSSGGAASTGSPRG